MAHFEALGEAMVNMYNDRYALLKNLRAFVRDLKESAGSFRNECRRANAERKREVARILKPLNSTRKREVAQMIQGFQEMVRRFHKESAERGAAWKQILAGIPRGPGRAEAPPEMPFPTGRRPGRRRAAEAGSEHAEAPLGGE